MPDAILVCYCPGVDKRAEATYKVLAKGQPIPKMYKGRYRISDFVSSLQSQGISGDVIDYAKALTKTDEKFAYYMKWGVEGNVEVQYNLLSGRRLK